MKEICLRISEGKAQHINQYARKLGYINNLEYGNFCFLFWSLFFSLQMIK